MKCLHTSTRLHNQAMGISVSVPPSIDTGTNILILGQTFVQDLTSDMTQLKMEKARVVDHDPYKHLTSEINWTGYDHHQPFKDPLGLSKHA